jgi:hypothetical protein
MEGAALPAESDHFRLLGLLVGASHVGRFAHRIFGFPRPGPTNPIRSSYFSAIAESTPGPPRRTPIWTPTIRRIAVDSNFATLMSSPSRLGRRVGWKVFHKWARSRWPDCLPQLALWHCR